MARRNSWMLLVVWIALLSHSLFAQGPAGSGVLNLIAFGDYGYDPQKSSQSVVAAAMAKYVSANSEKFDAALCLGDNLYVILTGTDDPQWLSLFENMYDRNVLSFPFYAVLGNHDYEHGKAAMELRYGLENPNSRWKMPARWYRVPLKADSGFAAVFALDSNMPVLKPDEWAKQKDWLDKQLETTRDAKFRIVFAHHPIYSNGQHADNGKLNLEWLATLEKRNVSLYLAGHDHDMQHLQIDGKKTTFVVSGGGGAPVRDMIRDNRGPFSKKMFGFVHMRITPAEINVKYIGIDGKIAHEFVRDADGNVKVIQSIGSDKASTKPLKVIQGGD